MIQPVILHEGSYDYQDLQNFKEQCKLWKEVTLYESQLEELFDVQHPHLLQTDDYNCAKASFMYKHADEEATPRGDWIYFPWSGVLCQMLTGDALRELRTNRNREIITRVEQQQLSEMCIGVCGLSVGGNMAISLGYNGIGSHYKLADFDKMSTSNLNRMLSTLPHVGTDKIKLVSQHLYELDPHLHVHQYNEGLNDDSLSHFLNADPKPSLIFEEIDDFAMKIKLRMEARKARIPVVMLTCIGDRLLVDIERYDLDDKTPLFNGLVDETVINHALDELTEEDKKQIALQIVNPENLDQNVIDSVRAINETLVGRPQVMSTILTSAGVAAYIARQIGLKKTNVSGRKVIRFDQTFIPE